MNADELLRQLGRTSDFPEHAIDASLGDWDAVSDRFLAKLRAAASGAELSTEDYDALFFIVHMFAEKRDKRAYAPLCRILAEQPDVSDWLSDAVIETLGNILISLYDGDPEPLKEIAEAAEAEPWARHHALAALGYLARAEGALSEEAMRAYLRAFAAKLTDVDDVLIGESWARTVAALGYDDLAPDVARALSKGLIDGDSYDIKDFYAELARAREAQSKLALFEEDGLGPFGSTLEILSQWDFRPPDDVFGEGIETDASDAFDDGRAANVPHVNLFRDVGRNDPCPCGSGKKYKKCCLAA